MIKLCVVAVFVSAGFVVAEAQELQPPKPAAEHQFLKRFGGEWECKSRDLIVLTGEAEGPDGKLMTLMKATCTRKK